MLRGVLGLAHESQASAHQKGLSRNERLVGSTDFAKVFQADCRSGDRLLLVLAIPNGLDRARLGLAVGRKAIRLAVQRNRIKRLVRESFRQRQHLLLGLDLVVVAKQAACGVSNWQLRSTLERHWRKVLQYLHSE